MALSAADAFAVPAAIFAALPMMLRHTGFQRFMGGRSLNAGLPLLDFLQAVADALENLGFMFREFLFVLLSCSLAGRRRRGLRQRGGRGQKKSKKKQFFHEMILSLYPINHIMLYAAVLKKPPLN
jgi:hypothetical protein